MQGNKTGKDVKCITAPLHLMAVTQRLCIK